MPEPMPSKPAQTPANPGTGAANDDKTAIPNWNSEPTTVATKTAGNPDQFPDGSIDWFHLGALGKQNLLFVTSSSTYNYKGNSGAGFDIPGAKVVHNEVPANETVQTALQKFITSSQTDPSEYGGLQQALYYGGFFGNTSSKDIHWGQWNEETGNAFVKAVKSYLQVSTTSKLPLTFNEFVNNAANAGVAIKKAAGGTGGTGGTTQVQLADPAALAASFTSAFQSAAGMAPTTQQINAFVSTYHSQQTASQSSTAGSVVVPDADGAAAAAVKSDDPGAVKQYATGNYMTALNNLFTGGSPSVSLPG